MRVSRWFLSTLLVVLVSGCSSMSVTQDYDPGVDFTVYRTYAWMDRPHADESEDPGFDAAMFESRLHSLVDEKMAKRGFQKAADSPDFLIAYHAAVQGKLDITAVNDYYGRSIYSGYANNMRWDDYGGNTYVREYNQGTLILDFLDQENQQLFWRSVAQAEVRDTDSPETRQSRLRRAVDKMLDRYPPVK